VRALVSNEVSAAAGKVLDDVDVTGGEGPQAAAVP
jgi:hypothetical protein